MGDEYDPCIYQPICKFQDCDTRCYKKIYFEGHISDKFKKILKSGKLEKILWNTLAKEK